MNEKVVNMHFSLEKKPFVSRAEESAGWMLSHNNKIMINNLIADIATEKLNMPVGEDVEVTLRTHEYLRGQLAVLNYLLATDKHARENHSDYSSYSEQPDIV